MIKMFEEFNVPPVMTDEIISYIEGEILNDIEGETEFKEFDLSGELPMLEEYNYYVVGKVNIKESPNRFFNDADRESDEPQYVYSISCSIDTMGISDVDGIEYPASEEQIEYVENRIEQ
jgi:hypothetical protein